MKIRSKIFFTVFLVYLFYIAPNYITANTNRYIILTKAMVNDNTFSVDNSYQYTRDYASYKGHYYIGAAPGLSFMAVPFYIAVKPVLIALGPALTDVLEFSILNLIFIFFLALLPGATIALLLYNLLGEFNLSDKEKVLIVFGSAFGTNLFYYSTRFMSPVMGTFLLFSAFYILHTYKDKIRVRWYLYFLSGLLLGASFLVDYTFILGAIFIVLYSLVNFKRENILRYVFLILGILTASCLFMYYHYKCFDNPFALATTYSRMIGPRAISIPNPKIMFELAFGTYRGIFLYMPITLLSVYGIFIFFKKPEKKHIPLVMLILIFSLSIFLLISGLSCWDGGGDFGPRYLIPFLPFLMIPIAFTYKVLKYRIIFWIVAISIFINWCGIQYGDSDNVFTNIGLFLAGGLNSGLAQWGYELATTYVRKFNVLTHFSPFIPFVLLMAFLYSIWKKEIYEIIHSDTGI